MNMHTIIFLPKKTIDQYNWNLSEEESENEYVVRIHQIMQDIIYWKDKFADDWNGFKDFIFDSIKYIDDNHFTYIVSENIAYPRALRDNTEKKYYCLLTGAKGYDRFKLIYKNMVGVKVDVDTLVDQISDLLITISDVYNYIVAKDLETSKEILGAYLNVNKNMSECFDIYYRRIYENLSIFYKDLDNMTPTEQLNFLKSIMIDENKKYCKYFVLYEKIAIDESSLEDIDYIELD